MHLSSCVGFGFGGMNFILLVFENDVVGSGEDKVRYGAGRHDRLPLAAAGWVLLLLRYGSPHGQLQQHVADADATMDLGVALDDRYLAVLVEELTWVFAADLADYRRASDAGVEDRIACKHHIGTRTICGKRDRGWHQAVLAGGERLNLIGLG